MRHDAPRWTGRDQRELAPTIRDSGQTLLRIDADLARDGREAIAGVEHAAAHAGTVEGLTRTSAGRSVPADAIRPRRRRSHMASESKKVVDAALAGNLLVAAAKFGASALSGSSAMLTEAIHSTADSANQVVLLIGGRRSQAPPDDTHPFGYGMEVYFWTFVVAVIVLLAGGVASLVEGWHHMMAPEPIRSPAISLGVLLLSAIFEGSSLAVGYREYKRQVRGRRIGGERVGLWRFIILSKDPNLYESLLEDSAALIGIVLAAIGVAGSVYGGFAWADGAASMAIGMLLIADSLVIAAATQSLIAGEGLSPLAMQDLREVLRSQAPRVVATDIKTLHLGPDKVLVTLTISMDACRDVGDVKTDLDTLVKRLRAVDSRIGPVYCDLADSPREAVVDVAKDDGQGRQGRT